MFLQILHLAQAALAGYGGQQSYVAITNLRKYEETSEKLAKWSNEAARQLHKTRTTMFSGAAAIVFSLFVSALLAFRGSKYGVLVRYLASPAMCAGMFFAKQHIADFWAGKDGKTVGARVPLPKMEDYNEAQRRTEELLKTLEFLMFSWFGTTLVALFGGY